MSIAASSTFLMDMVGKSESEIKQLLQNRLESDFEIRPDYPGLYLVDRKTKVIPDFLLKPREHLLAKGFNDSWIPLEVKELKDDDNLSVRAAWQCITYAQSEFDGERPAFALIFPPWNFFLKNGAECIQAHCIRPLALIANVGELSFNKRNKWEIHAGGQRFFFSEEEGLGPQPQALLKRRVGTPK